MDSRTKIKNAGDKNPCQAMLCAIYMDQLLDALTELRKICKDIFQDAYQNALKENCYAHFKNKYCRAEYVNAFAWHSPGTCHIIEFTFNGYLKEDAEFEDNGLINLNSRGPIEDKFRMYEYEFVDYLK